MSNQKLIVILGVTGQQGGSVAEVFKTLPDWRIRGVTRNPNKPSNASLKEAGIELVAGDLDDVTSLEKAFKDADAIFSVTDFWQFLSETSSTFAEAQQAGRPPNQIAMEKEVQQGKNIVDAAAKAHANKPLHRFVLSYLSDSNKWTQGQITKNLHFDGKAHYVDYMHEKHPDLTKVASYCQVGYYLTNFFSFSFWSPQKDPNGDGYIFGGTHVPNGKPLPFVNPPHDMGYFVEALVNKAPAGTDMLGYHKLMDLRGFVKLWGETLGVKSRDVPLVREDLLKNGLPDWLIDEIMDSAMYVSKWGWDGGDTNVKSPEECGVDVSKLTDLKTWIKEQDWKL